MAYVLVDDPLHSGRGPAPQILRTWAMRKLFDAGGVTVGDVARRYDVPYSAAYRAINPERKPAPARSGAASKRDRILDPELIKSVKTSELKKIVRRKGASLSDPRDAAAYAELERRDPKWDES